MKVSITSGRNSVLLAAVVFSVLAGPALAMASVQFTEVMYDAPGSDQGREWIEVSNTGSSTADLTGYKLFESGVNHGLTVVQGSAQLAAGESAVIAANPSKFLGDYPSYAGTIFKSSFSLTNIGESVALRDKSLANVDTLAYSASDGASGDGNSLHLSASGSWVPGIPNPGSAAATKAIAKPALVATKSVAKPSAKTSSKSTKTPSKTTNKSSVQSSSSGSYTPNSGQSAAASFAPLIPAISSVWLYALGLVALLGLGVSAVLFVRPQRLLDETATASPEFEIE